MRLLRALRPRDRRALLVGVGVLVPALAWAWGIRPALGALEQHTARLEEQRGLLERELALVDAARGLSERGRDAEAALAAAGSRLFAGDALAAGTVLAAWVTASARRAGVQVEELQSRPSAPVGAGLEQVEIAVRGHGDLAGALRWLRDLEGGGRLIRVERIALERVGTPAAADSNDVEVLAVSATVRGYVRAAGRAQ